MSGQAEICFEKNCYSIKLFQRHLSNGKNTFSFPLKKDISAEGLNPQTTTVRSTSKGRKKVYKPIKDANL